MSNYTPLFYMALAIYPLLCKGAYVSPQPERLMKPKTSFHSQANANTWQCYRDVIVPVFMQAWLPGTQWNDTRSNLDTPPDR